MSVSILVVDDRASSLCGRLAGRSPAEMRGEKGARLRLRILGRRLVVFEQVAEIVDAGGQLSDIKIMMGSRINGESDRCAIPARQSRVASC